MVLLFLVFVALNILDVILTKDILKRGGVELNPIIKKIGTYPVKIGGVLLFGGLAYITESSLVLDIGIIMVGGVCIWNMIQWCKIRKG